MCSHRVPESGRNGCCKAVLARGARCADEDGVEHHATDIDGVVPPATDHTLADELAEEILDAAREEGDSPDPSEYPGLLEIAASAGVAAGVVALGYASWASGAAIPFLWVFDFGIHEFGHLVTYWLPWPITASAGSVLQVAAPLSLAAYALLVRGHWRVAGVLVAWAGCSARNVAVYIADAPYQRLLLWGGDGVLHDWAHLLQGRPMRYAATIAWSVDAAGWLLVAAGFALVLAPVVLRAVVAHGTRARAAAEEAYKATLPVREPYGPVG